jgi:CDP-diacylglycerol--glycerol-3-phosphate 3-phosphatidyltransferase
MNPAIALTFSRLFFALIFSFSFYTAAKGNLYSADKVYLLIAIICVVIIELSDAFDGIIARRRGEVTRFGKIFDPVCDSISRQTIICTFMATDIIPLWMFLIFLYRDAILSFLRVMCAIDGTVMAAKTAGKIKAVLQAVGIICVLTVTVAYTFNIGSLPATVWGKHPGYWILWYGKLLLTIRVFSVCQR